jgi:hypothetical protein
MSTSIKKGEIYIKLCVRKPEWEIYRSCVNQQKHTYKVFQIYMSFTVST